MTPSCGLLHLERRRAHSLRPCGERRMCISLTSGLTKAEAPSWWDRPRRYESVGTATSRRALRDLPRLFTSLCGTTSEVVSWARTVRVSAAAGCRRHRGGLRRRRHHHHGALADRRHYHTCADSSPGLPTWAFFVCLSGDRRCVGAIRGGGRFLFKLLRPAQAARLKSPIMCSQAVACAWTRSVLPEGLAARPAEASMRGNSARAGCKAGYTLRSRKCQRCAAGTYKRATGNGACSRCAGNTYSAAGATKCRSAAAMHAPAVLSTMAQETGCGGMAFGQQAARSCRLARVPCILSNMHGMGASVAV